MTSGRRMAALGTLPVNLDPALRRVLEEMRETLGVVSGQQGDPLDRAPSLREMVDYGLLEFRQGSRGPGSVSVGLESSLGQAASSQEPPQVGGVSVTATARFVYITAASVSGPFSHIEVWAQGPSDDPIAPSASTATLRGRFTNVFQMFVEPDKYYRFYLRAVALGGRIGPWHSIEGSEIQVPLTPGAVFGALEEEIGGFNWQANPAVEGLFAGKNGDDLQGMALVADRLYVLGEDPTVASALPFVVDTVNNRVAIDGAYMKFASIDVAAIANLTADAITTGTLSGVLIQGNAIRGGTLGIGTAGMTDGFLTNTGEYVKTYIDEAGNISTTGSFLLQSSTAPNRMTLTDQTLTVYANDVPVVKLGLL